MVGIPFRFSASQLGDAASPHCPNILSSVRSAQLARMVSPGPWSVVTSLCVCSELNVFRE